MNIPGLFVEYLVSGALALVWLYPKFFWLYAKFLPGKPETIHPSYLALFALGLYVVGMIIDFFAGLLTLPLKMWLRKMLRRAESRKTSKGSVSANLKDVEPLRMSTICQIKFALYAPEIAKESAMRSSRDRVARGAILNSVLLTIFVWHSWIALVLILAMVLMWLSFESSSYSYDLRAEQVVDEKIAWDRSHSHV